MNNSIVTIILTFIFGGGLISYITSLITLKYTKKQAEANAMKSVQDVYQELIKDMRSAMENLKKEKEDVEKRLSLRIESLELKQKEMEKKVDDNENKITKLETLKCKILLCNKRQQRNRKRQHLANRMQL